MVGKKKKSRAHSQELMGGHQKCWLWGRHAVMETLRARHWAPIEVYWDPTVLTKEMESELFSIIRRTNILSVEATSEEMKRFCGSGDHQGLMAKMPPYPYLQIDQVLKRLKPESIVLVLCGIQDPFNFGSILRSADMLGVSTVILPSSGQAQVSSHVVRSSVGAVNYLDLVQVDDLEEACRQLKASGFQLSAATEHADVAPASVDLTQGVAMLIGNEGTGVPTPLLALSDHQVAIPQKGHVGSLNAAVAAGILCYEIQRQRNEKAASTRS
ncbi:23S rRNA (guanosine(2251)-2'-O)-methyltransferase RlmB [Planctomicrobium sp. SH527]|uniref:23S rRNA (guanosine(2251)-2'-O)-methyltransferase RlmB n=1 Tax=Planctomicrobium sp. SH527 TaxID=3448123 RepID=UPI003F5C70DA